jgi:hypothetical protein
VVKNISDGQPARTGGRRRLCATSAKAVDCGILPGSLSGVKKIKSLGATLLKSRAWASVSMLRVRVRPGSVRVSRADCGRGLGAAPRPAAGRRPGPPAPGFRHWQSVQDCKSAGNGSLCQWKPSLRF